MEDEQQSVTCREINIFLPLYAGNAVRKADGDVVFDGCIATKVVSVLLMAVVSVEVFLQLNNFQAIVCAEVVQISLTIIVLLGCMSCLVVFRSTFVNQTQWVVPDSKGIFTISARLRLLFLWLFGICSIVVAGMKVSVMVNCIETINTAHSYYVSDIIFSTAKITFIIIELFFIGYYSSIRLKRSLKLSYCLTFIIVGNLSLWVYYFALDFDFIGLQRNIASRLDHSGLNGTMECLFNSTPGLIFNKTKRVLFPTLTEFALLAAMFILQIWWSSIEQSRFVFGDEYPICTNRRFRIDDERSYLLIEGTDSNRRGHSNRKSCTISFFATIFVGCAAFVPLSMMYIVLLHGYHDTTDLYNNILEYQLGYKIFALILIVYAWILLQMECKPAFKFEFLKPKDYLTILCAFGVACYYTNLVFVGTGLPARSGPKEAAEGIVSLAVLYLQTVFLLQAKGYVTKVSHKKACCSIELVCLLMAILNFGFWINDSFLGIRFPSSVTPKKSILGPHYWPFVIHYIFPFTIFYRFDSSFEFLELHKAFRN